MSVVLPGPRRPSTIAIDAGRWSPRERAVRRESAVFSFVGVLGITLVLFFVVALTGRLILGR